MQKKQGISLIVLVITIIVMIILAGAIVLTLNNIGIIQKASDAVEQTNLATVKELTQMAWATAYASGDTVLDELQSAVDKALTDNKVDTTKYAVEVSLSGVNVVLKGPWVQTGETVTDGETIIKVGEKINYIATGTDYEGGWKVLGASKYGELLIMSDSDVISNYRLGYKSTTTDTAERLKEGQNSWLNGAAELDAICEPYGKGEGATGARSVTVEDIDRVTEFEKTTFNEDQLYKYGNKVTYTYNTDTKKVAYTSTNGKIGTLSGAHNNGFHYYNGNEFILSTTTAELTSNFYGYGLTDEGLWDGDLELADEASLLIFGEYDSDVDAYSNYYWLASQYVSTGTAYAVFGMRSVDCGSMYYCGLWSSNGLGNYGENGVRAVVSLATDVNIAENSAGGWKIN